MDFKKNVSIGFEINPAYKLTYIIIVGKVSPKCLENNNLCVMLKDIC